jgi:hypothetical protein
MADGTINIKNLDKRAHIIGEAIIKPLFAARVSASWGENPVIRALVKAGKLATVAEEEAEDTNETAQKAVEARLTAAEDALRKEARDLKIKDSAKLDKDALMEAIKKARDAG